MTKAEKYFEKFTQLLNSGVPIINETTSEQFALEDGEVFKQCWADTTERKTFPKYWFISNKGNLLSVYREKILWLHKNPRVEDGEGCYKYFIKTGKHEKVIKNIEIHNLVGLVFDSESFGLAEQKLKKEGVYAFGVNNKEVENVQGHHLDGNHENNNPTNIKFLTDKVHILLDSIPSPEANGDEEIKFMEKFSEIARKENPNGISIILPRYSYNIDTKQWNITSDIKSTKKIIVTKNFVNQLISIIKFLTENDETVE